MPARTRSHESRALSPWTFVGHGRGALLTHGIVEREPSLVRRALWYSPSIGLATILRRVLERSVSEGRLYERFRSSMALEFGDSLGA